MIGHEESLLQTSDEKGNLGEEHSYDYQTQMIVKSKTIELFSAVFMFCDQQNDLGFYRQRCISFSVLIVITSLS